MGSSEQNTNRKSFLQQYDGPCPSCGFHLKNSTSDRCPECGYLLIPTLRQPHRPTAWLLFLLGLVASMGVCIDQLGLFLAARLYQGSPLAWMYVLPEMLLISVLAGGVLVWWKLRTWVGLFGIRTKVAIGLLGIALPVILFNILFWIFVTLIQ